MNFLLKQISISHPPGNYSITCGLNLESDEDLSNNSISINITSQEEINCPDVYNLPIAWRDYFECYDAFTIDNFGEWISYDLDGGTTWGQMQWILKMKDMLGLQ